MQAKRLALTSRDYDNRGTTLMERLERFEQKLDQIINDLSEVKEESAGFSGEFRQRVLSLEIEQKNHSDELKALGTRLNAAEKWRNFTAGKMAGIGTVFTVLGALVLWALEHLFGGTIK